MTSKGRRFFSNPHFRALILLSFFALLAFYLYYDRKLVLDDWPQIVSDSVFGRMEWFDWSQRRPLDMMAYKAILAIFGLYIPIFYAINFLIILGVFFMVYILVDRLLPGLRPFGLAAALIAMLYPADYTMTWITMINNRLAWLITLVAMWLLLDYAARGGRTRLALAGFGLFLPLWIHEGSLGIVIAWCLFLALTSRQASVIRRLALLSPLVPITIFMVLRIFIRPMMGIVDSNVFSFNNLTIGLLWDRLKQMKILAWAWIKPFPEFIQRLELTVPPSWMIMIGLLLVMTLSILTFYVVLRLVQVKQYAVAPLLEKTHTGKKIGWAILFSFGFLLAGYFPTLIVRPPNLDDVSSRANMYAIPVAALIIVAIAGLIALTLARSKRQWQTLIWAAVLPLILLGLVIQIGIQKRGQFAWAQQKNIWQMLFQIAPDFEDDTTVVLIVHGYDQLRFGEHPPLYAEWEVDHGLKVLYENDSLTGRILFPEAEIYSEATFTSTDVLGARPWNKTAYENTVFLLYRPNNGILNIVDDLDTELGLPFSVATYDPQSRIQTIPKKTWQYRYLVNDEVELVP